MSGTNKFHSIGQNNYFSLNRKCTYLYVPNRLDKVRLNLDPFLLLFKKKHTLYYSHYKKEKVSNLYQALTTRNLWYVSWGRLK